MSKVLASTEASSAFDLRDEIGKKLMQADAICTAVRLAGELHTDHRTVEGSLWAASELIGDAKKAVDALYEQARSVEEVQS
jgi:hypothetical protein